MLSLLGCPPEDMQDVLGALGYRGRPETQPDGTTVLLFKPKHRGPKPPERERGGRDAEKPKRDFKPRRHAQRHARPHDRNKPRDQHKDAQTPPATHPPAADQPAAHQQAKTQPRPKPKHEPRRDTSRPQREVRIDPNSPFAKLAILKNKT
jgi:hypothetical protein